MARGHASEVDLSESGDWHLHVSPGHVEVRRDRAAWPEDLCPAAVGDRWVYRNGVTGTPGFVSEEVVVRGAWQGDRWVARVATRSPEHPLMANERSMIVTDAGVLPDIGPMTSAAGEVILRGTTGLFLPRGLVPGQRWQYTQDWVLPQMPMQVAATCEAVGVVPVDVPAGRFMALMVRMQVHSEFVMAGLAHTREQDDTSYFVRGIGLVLHQTRQGEGQTIDKVLLAYSVGAARGGSDSAL